MGPLDQIPKERTLGLSFRNATSWIEWQIFAQYLAAFRTKALDVRRSNAKHATMSEKIPTDPFSMFRDMVNQWEKAANDYGGKIAGSSEFARSMQGATAISMQIQQAVHEGMTKVLAATNIPSREDLAALGERVGNIEAQLSRIESALGAPTTHSSSPKPSRTKQPPTKSK